MGNSGSNSRDITEKREAADALRNSEEHYRLLYDNAGEAIFSYDSELILTDINRVGCEAIGYSEEELLGKNILELGILHPDDMESAANAIGRHFDGEDIIEAEYTFIRKDGAERLFTVTGAAIRNPDRNLQSITNMCRDITEERRAEEALRRTQFTVDQNADSVFWVTSKGKIIYANDEACRRRGYTREEMLSLTIFDINVNFAADPGIWESCVERIQREGHVVIEFRHRTKGGEVFPVEAMLNYYELEDKWLFVSSVRDITERKAAEEALRRSEEQYRLLADSLPEIVFEMDLEGNLLYVSMSAFTFQGYTQEEFEKGMTVADVLVDWKKSVADLGTRIEKNIGEASGEYIAIKKDGSTAPVIISSRLVYDNGGKVVGLSGVVTDITEQKKTEEKLKRMNVELHGYAHTVSHDLKNPISNVVFGCETLQNLLDLPLTDQNITYIKEVAELIINGSVKAAALIDELLLLAESGQVPKEIENVDVDEEVRLIITDKSLQADGVKFNTNDLGTVVASPTHVYQIFSNLISNAVRFNNSDEPRIDILRLPSEEGSVHRFLVKDNGPGIPEEIIDKIFIPFTKDKEKGETGIGLSIVERMVKVYGGDIRAYNDNGACFEFTLKDFSYQAS